jgi:hypothetical protein
MSANRRSQSPSYDPSEEAGGPRPEEDWPVVRHEIQHAYYGSQPAHFNHPPIQFAEHHHVGPVEFAPPPIVYEEPYRAPPPVEYAAPPIAYEEPYQAPSMSMSEYIKRKKYLETRLFELTEEDDRLNQAMTDNHDVFANLDRADPRYHDINGYMRQNRNFHELMQHKLMGVQTAIDDIENDLDKQMQKIERLKRKTAHYS